MMIWIEPQEGSSYYSATITDDGGSFITTLEGALK